MPVLADYLLLPLPGSVFSLGSQDGNRSGEESRTGMFFTVICRAWMCGLYVTVRCWKLPEGMNALEVKLFRVHPPGSEAFSLPAYPPSPLSEIPMICV